MGLLKSLKKVAKVALPAVGGLIGGPAGAALGKVGAGLLGSSGAKNAAGAIVGGNQNAIDFMNGAYGQARQDMQPYQAAGTDALGRLNSLYSGDYSGFNESPDYKYALEQGQQAVQRAASATGNLASGNTLLELTRNAQGMASQNLGNYTNRLMQLAGMGQNAAGTLVNAGMGNAQGVGGLMAGQGQARASGIVGSTNAWGNVLDGVLNGGGLSGLLNTKVGGNGGGIVSDDVNSLGMQALGQKKINRNSLSALYGG